MVACNGESIYNYYVNIIQENRQLKKEQKLLLKYIRRLSTTHKHKINWRVDRVVYGGGLENR